ncbi:hypothetical protein QBC37DRAFT_349228 [Rhypophila decipiens]|uniref:Uncharacterized protein n=1 Tax=Rhypophila decipiens TaxID=261697 RepID=A0AAN6Y3Z7_9PEZI|nr:hypothetical protein QBC37DRAFT_349228 [Rhypophila decipiens]
MCPLLWKTLYFFVFSALFFALQRFDASVSGFPCPFFYCTNQQQPLYNLSLGFYTLVDGGFGSVVHAAFLFEHYTTAHAL